MFLLLSVLILYFIDVPVGWLERSAVPEYIVKLAFTAPAVSVAAVQVVPLSLLISAVKSVFNVDESIKRA